MYYNLSSFEDVIFEIRMHTHNITCALMAIGGDERRVL